MLERYGILTREQVLAEGVPGGFSAIYPELSQLETWCRAPGLLRRGPRRSSVRAARGGRTAALPRCLRRRRRSCWPRSIQPSRTARRSRGPRAPIVQMTHAARRASPGAYVVLAGGEPVLYVERGGRALQTLVSGDDPRLEPALVALVEQVRAGRLKRIALEKVDGESAIDSPLGPALVGTGLPAGAAPPDPERLSAD